MLMLVYVDFGDNVGWERCLSYESRKVIIIDVDT